MALDIPQVHPAHRFLQLPSGKPFFLLADTAWELFHRTTREEAEKYLSARSRQGFNTIQAVLLAEFDGLRTPNAYGHRPLLENDPTKPDPAGYWEYVDWVVERAGQLGLYVALLPTWGDKVNKAWGEGPIVFDEGNAYIYGSWVAKRYGHLPNVFWINGGDRDPADRKAVWQAIAKGIRDHEKGRRLMTYHPQGGRSSSADFHSDDWLDFHMMQSGHWDFGQRADQMIERDYSLQPPKPTLDGEPNYENHRPFKDDFTLPYFRDFDVRRASYWSVFAGGCGVTYGCHAVWQMAGPRYSPINKPLGTMLQSLELPGARQMHHLKNLMLSRPYFERVPDQGLIQEGLMEGDLTARATRASDGSYAFVYLPGARPIRVDEAKLRSPLQAWWFDPRNGKATPTEQNDGFYHAPTAEDWVLVLDEKARAFPPPGQP